MWNDEYFQRTFSRLCRSQDAKTNRRLMMIAVVAALLSLGIRAMVEHPVDAQATRLDASIATRAH